MIKNLKRILPARGAGPAPMQEPISPLPALRPRSPSFLEGYVVPRVSGPETQPLPLALASGTRDWLVGESGTGKTAALRYLSLTQPGAQYVNLRDFHPAALPREFHDATSILLDDAGPEHLGYLNGLAFPAARVVAASTAARPAGAEEAGWAALTLQELNDREIYTLAEAWFPAPRYGHGDIKGRSPGAAAFAAAIKGHPEARHYAARPLDLYLLLQVYVPGRPLPATRTELFRAYVDAVVARATDPALALRGLQGIALSVKRGQLAQEDHLERGCGFLTRRPNGRIVFSHPDLQDFLAAQALRLNPDFAPMRERLSDPDWSRVVRFYAGLGLVDELIPALQERDPYLAGEALAQQPAAPAELKAAVAQDLVRRAWEKDDGRALEVLGALKSAEATDYLAARLKDRNPEVRARAASALGHVHTDKALEFLLPQLRDADPVVRQRVVDALGRSKSERVLEPLLVALRGDTRALPVDLSLRVAAAAALGQVGNDKAAPALLVDLQTAEPPVRDAAARALAQIRSDFAVRPLRDIAATATDPDVRAAAAGVLETYAASPRQNAMGMEK